MKKIFKIYILTCKAIVEFMFDDEDSASATGVIAVINLVLGVIISLICKSIIVFNIIITPIYLIIIILISYGLYELVKVIINLVNKIEQELENK